MLTNMSSWLAMREPGHECCCCMAVLSVLSAAVQLQRHFQAAGGQRAAGAGARWQHGTAAAAAAQHLHRSKCCRATMASMPWLICCARQQADRARRRRHVLTVRGLLCAWRAACPPHTPTRAGAGFCCCGNGIGLDTRSGSNDSDRVASPLTICATRRCCAGVACGGVDGWTSSCKRSFRASLRRASIMRRRRCVGGHAWGGTSRLVRSQKG